MGYGVSLRLEIPTLQGGLYFCAQTTNSGQPTVVTATWTHRGSNKYGPPLNLKPFVGSFSQASGFKPGFH